MATLPVLRLQEFRRFSREFGRVVSDVRSVLFSLILLIVLGGVVLFVVEELTFWEGQYLAFVTSLTIGYGDLSPSAPVGRVVCIVLGVVGMVWMGLVVGLASVALRRTVDAEQGEANEGGGN